jgi:cytochrome c biogenesis protein CcmG/thiol:disulfide interchange protein DsbE
VGPLSRLPVLAAGLALLVAACGGEPEAVPAGRADPQALERLRSDANRPLDGGAVAFRSRLASLRGHPVVVNQWASWCGPCQYEFPFFARLARRYGDRVAFLGVDSKDSRAGARFLARHPVPFPHYFDPDGSVARVFRGGRAFPTTAFYDAEGRLVATHSGAYASEARLDDDIRRHALDG